MKGTVTWFDDPRGIGVVTGDDGREFPFHCTAIADGTRHIEVGAPVIFEARPAHLGRMEALGIAPAP